MKIKAIKRLFNWRVDHKAAAEIQNVRDVERAKRMNAEKRYEARLNEMVADYEKRMAERQIDHEREVDEIHQKHDRALQAEQNRVLLELRQLRGEKETYVRAYHALLDMERESQETDLFMAKIAGAADRVKMMLAEILRVTGQIEDGKQERLEAQVTRQRHLRKIQQSLASTGTKAGKRN